MKEFLIFSRAVYHWVGFKLCLLVFLMSAAVLLEGLSVGLFLPLLQGVEADNKVNAVLSALFQRIGWPYTYRSILIFMVAFFFLRSAFLVLQASYVGKIVNRFLVYVRHKVVREIFEADYRYLIQKNIGFLNNAVVNELLNVKLAFKMYTAIVVKLIFIGMYTVLPLVVNFELTSVILILAIPAFFIVKKINALTKAYAIRQSDHLSGLQKLLIQALGYFKYFKATHAHESAVQKINRESEILGDIQYRASILQAVTRYAFEPFGIAALAGLLLYQVEVLGKQVLEVVFLIYLLRQAISNLLGLQQAFRKFLSSAGGQKVFFKLDRELAEHAEPIHPEGVLPNFNQPICFKEVSFAYQKDRPILQDITLTIPPRATVAIVGQSGSGKSTLANLLTGLLKPTQGAIWVGETDYTEINQKALRQAIGYITQENVIFNDTICNNITLWNTDFTEEDIRRAAAQAHIHTFSEALPRAYDTLLGDGGINLSGGQRQRIMIARELCKPTQLLIFDEATSALDTQTENEIQKNIQEIQGQKTLILIAHRLSTVRNSDLIVVMKNGRIAEQGTYAHLLALGGEFRRMVDQQSTDRPADPIDRPALSPRESSEHPPVSLP